MQYRKIFNLDTNILIEIIRSNKAMIQKLTETVSQNDAIAISDIVYYEVMRGFNENTSRKKLTLFKELYNDALHLSLNKKSLNIAVNIYQELRKTGQLIEDADIFIAAISIANDAVLVTDNVKHFGRIPTLNILNWK